jgi:ubiquinol-cytochrome c reductase cytochrome c1 subunit
MRYNRLRDLGLTEEQIKQNLLFSADKVGDTMHIAMDREDAKKWFGAMPPDLSVIARARGSDWLYTYLRTFYRDDTRPTGWNNLVFDKVGMPHVLWELQGQRVPKYEAVKSEHGGEMEHKLVGFEQVTPGKLNSVEYDQAVADLVTYLDWMAEPAGNLRKRLGVWVLLFIGVFFVLAWRLNAAYWKDIK